MSSLASDSGADASLVWTAIAAPSRSVLAGGAGDGGGALRAGLVGVEVVVRLGVGRERARSTLVCGRSAGESDGTSRVRRLASAAAA